MLKTICENNHEKKTGILSQFGLEKVRMVEYISKKSVDNLPRLPLEGSLDLTYRCNNNCWPALSNRSIRLTGGVKCSL